MSGRKRETQVLTLMQRDELAQPGIFILPSHPLVTAIWAPSACTQLWSTSSYTGPLEVSKCFIITIYLFPSVHECLKEEIQTSPNQIQLQKETKTLIQFSIWPWTCVLTTLSSNTAPNLTTPETLLLSHWTAFPSAASQLCPAICCCFRHPHSKSLHTSLFVGSSHHTPD